MKCSVCRHGDTRAGVVTVPLTRAGMTLVVVRGVPAEVCETCGEDYVAEDVSRTLLAVAEEALLAGVRLDVRDYRAA